MKKIRIISLVVIQTVFIALPSGYLFRVWLVTHNKTDLIYSIMLVISFFTWILYTSKLERKLKSSKQQLNEKSQ
jgi:hypothetical protein